SLPHTRALVAIRPWRASVRDDLGDDHRRMNAGLLAPAHQRLQSVVRGVLVRVAERGVVENALDEEVDRAAEGQARHPDVNQLARAFTDHGDAEQTLVFGCEEQLHVSVEIADDLAARVESERGAAHEVGDATRRELLLALADGRDFWNRPHAVWK